MSGPKVDPYAPEEDLGRGDEASFFNILGRCADLALGRGGDFWQYKTATP
jgi:hypothetical protein